MKHNLKIEPEFYEAIESGKKTFEIRKNDRNYSVGDTILFLVLPELEPSSELYTITYVTEYKQRKNYVVFSIEKIERYE